MKDLTCGPFTLTYQNGFVRYIRYGDKEILRMIYFALRDENWGTHSLKVYDEVIDSTNGGFRIHYHADSHSDNVVFIRWIVTIEGKATGEIVFSIDGEVMADHRKNRAGFCVLHPLRETIGQPVVILHDDATTTEHTFPEYIAPEDPFLDIVQMKWQVNDHWYSLRFSGDVFETEDQRNWSDASFKTFCTPLSKPFPAELKKGERIGQKVIFKPEQRLKKLPTSDIIKITTSQKELVLPAIGISSSPSEEFTEEILKSLKAIRFDHYRIDVDLSNIEWQDSFTNDVLISERLELPLEIVMHLPQDPRDALDDFLNLFDKERVPVRKITVLSKGELTTRDHHLEFIPFLKSIFPTAAVGAGTDFNFTELNRHRFSESAADYVTFGLDPQEHASDDLTIIENLEAQYYGVISARNIYNTAAHVSPVLLKRKYNPYATNPAAFHISEEERIEPRQQTPFCAVWTLGSIKQMAAANASAVTYFQTVGPHGIISNEGEEYPVFRAFQLLREAGSNEAFETHSSKPLQVDGIVFKNNKVLLWNYTSSDQTVSIPERGIQITIGPMGFIIV